MRKSIVVVAVMAGSIGLMEGSALAWGVAGAVYCDANLNGVIDEGDVPVGGLVVTVKGSDNSFTGTTQTAASGAWALTLPAAPGAYTVTISGNTAPVISPTFPSFTLTNSQMDATMDFLLDGSGCQDMKCWLSGGGTRFSSAPVTERGPQHIFGGNLSTACSGEPGDEGSWSHQAHALKLQFHGQQIRVVRCGSVPATPSSFIEFEGTGTLKGTQGNKEDYGIVTFFARVEDRDEQGVSTDRYFLRVVDGAGVTRVLADGDGNDATVDPAAITGGNLQILISSCTK